MSRNLFSEQISKPFCQLYVGSWKFHFLTSCCFSQLYVGLLEASLLNFLCLVSNCMLVLVEVCFGTSVDSWKVVRCFPNQVFDQCRWLSFVFEAVEPKKIDKLSLFVLSVIMWTHGKFLFRKFFHLKGGWAGSPFVKREALCHAPERVSSPSWCRGFCSTTSVGQTELSTVDFLNLQFHFGIHLCCDFHCLAVASLHG